MGAYDREQIVGLQELAAGGVRVEVRAAADRVVAKEVGVTLVTEVGTRVGPQQIAHWPIGRWVTEPVERTYVAQRAQLGREAAVHAQELLVEEGGERQTVERFHARLVHALRVLDATLLAEGEVRGQVAALVVAAQQVKRLRVQDFHRPQVQYTLFGLKKTNKFKIEIVLLCDCATSAYFDAEVAAVDIVAEEEVARVGRLAADLEQLDQVVELAVHVAADGDGRVHLEHGGLATQQRRAVVYDAQGGGLLEASLAHQVLLEHVGAWQTRCRVEHLLDREQMRRRR